MILVTRPEEASLRTKARLEARGHDVLLDPLLALRFCPPEKLVTAAPDAIVVTSANGAHAVKDHPDLGALKAVPVWTVGSRTSEAVRNLGFSVAGEAPDAVHLVELLREQTPQTLIYLAAENRSAELAELLPPHKVETRVVYSAVPKRALADATTAALEAGRVTHVLHYSRRLAETYLGLARAAGIERKALAPSQICLSEQVAAPLRGAGAPVIGVAVEPKEDALIGLLERPLSSPSGKADVR